MKRAVAAGLVLATLALGAPRAVADDGSPPAPLWSSSSARPMAFARWEAGLVHGLHFGFSNRLELSANPLLFFALPHVEAKVLWTRVGSWDIASAHRLSYPTLFLSLVAREGAGGLLPATTDVPIAIGLDSTAIASTDLRRWLVLSAELGVSVAPRLTSGKDLPLLDFPFLYPRFAALKTIATGHVGVTLDGRFANVLHYVLDLDVYALPVIAWGGAVEQGTSLGWRPSDRFEVLAGCRLSYARYPVGDRFHYLPYADVIFAF